MVSTYLIIVSCPVEGGLNCALDLSTRALEQQARIQIMISSIVLYTHALTINKVKFNIVQVIYGAAFSLYKMVGSAKLQTMIRFGHTVHD